MSSPLVSVVLPVHNGVDYVLDAVDSVLAQTYPNIDLVVIDDGSTDGTHELLGKVRDDRLTVVRQSNQGLSGARNAGLAASDGDLVAFIDADDVWLDTHVESQVRVAGRGRFVYSAFELWNATLDERLGGFDLVDRFPGSRDLRSGRVFVHLLAQDFIAVSGVMMARDDIDAIGIFHQHFSPSEDWDYWLRCAERLEFVFVEQPPVIIRVRGDSLSGDRGRMQAAGKAVLDSVWGRLQARGSVPADIRGAVGLGYFGTRNMVPAARHLLAAALRQPTRWRWWRWLAASLVWRPIRLVRSGSDVRS